MKKIRRLTVAVIIFLTCFNSFLVKYPETSRVRAAEAPITIDKGSRFSFDVPMDSHSAVEALPAGYVQNNSSKPNLEKVALGSYSAPAYSTIRAAYPQKDGTYLLVMEVDNKESRSKPYRIATNFILKVDQNGNILKSKSVPKNKETLSASFTRSSENSHEFSRYYASEVAADGKVILYCLCQKPGDTKQEYRVIVIDSALNMTYSNVKKVTLPSQQAIAGLHSLPTSGEVVQASYIYASVLKDNFLEVYTVDDRGENTKRRRLTVPSVRELAPENYHSNWQIVLEQYTAYDSPSGKIAGAIRFYMPGSAEVRYTVVLWDETGHIISKYKLPNNHTQIIVQKKLSSGDNYYFIENDRENRKSTLKKMNMRSGEITICQEFPDGTNMQIEPQRDSKYPYRFYGSIEEATGIFSGYGNYWDKGAVTGVMNQDFSLVNASIDQANGSIDQSICEQGANGYMFVAGSTTATNFSSRPSNGWQDQSKISSIVKGNAYFGSMKVVDDYAPAIHVGEASVINRDTVDRWDTALLNGVQVTDKFDLSPNQGNRGMSWLQARINRNPLNAALAYDWEALGLNKNKTGPNHVTYFVTDSLLQTSAASKVVNIIDHTTAIDDEQKLALNAYSFDIRKEAVAGLTAELAKDADHGKTFAWNMVSGAVFTADDIKADETELKAIQRAAKSGAYPLTFQVTHDGATVQKRISVYVTDENTVIDQGNDRILFANDFSLDFREAKGFRSDDVVKSSTAAVYKYSTGEKQPTEKIRGDAVPINQARTIGPVKVKLTFEDRNVKLETQVTATILNDRTVDPNGGDEEPDDKENLNPEPDLLSITYASPIDFGTKKLNKQDYEATSISFGGHASQMQPAVQIANYTTGAAGWKLTVKQPAQFKGADQTELRGAKLAFNIGNKTALTRKDNSSPAPTQRSIEIVAFNCDYEVMTAQAGQGGGIWSTNFEEVKLIVPDGVAKAQRYQTELVWTLSNTPS